MRDLDLALVGNGSIGLLVDPLGTIVWGCFPRFDSDLLFTAGLAAGLGSNDIGLDRGGQAGARVVQFQRVGPRVLLVQNNLSFRSSSANPLERKAVEDSFARSSQPGIRLWAGISKFSKTYFRSASVSAGSNSRKILTPLRKKL